MTFDASKISFLDAEVTVGPSGNLLGSLYQKPTAGNTILRFNSTHAEPLKCSVTFSQCIGRIWSSDLDFKHQAGLLQTKLLECGYLTSLLKKAYNQALLTNLDELLYPKSEKSTDSVVWFVSTYDSKHRQISNILGRFWFLLNSDPILMMMNYVCPRPSIMFRWSRSLKDSLVSSHFKDSLATCSDLKNRNLSLCCVRMVNTWTPAPKYVYLVVIGGGPVGLSPAIRLVLYSYFFAVPFTSEKRGVSFGGVFMSIPK